MAKWQIYRKILDQQPYVVELSILTTFHFLLPICILVISYKKYKYEYIAVSLNTLKLLPEKDSEWNSLNSVSEYFEVNSTSRFLQNFI